MRIQRTVHSGFYGFALVSRSVSPPASPINSPQSSPHRSRPGPKSKSSITRPVGSTLTAR